MALMPRLRIPLWAAAGLPVVAYLGRSFVRGSFALDLPEDLVVIAALGFVLALSALYGSAAQRRRDELSGEVQDKDDGGGSGRQDTKV